MCEPALRGIGNHIRRQLDQELANISPSVSLGVLGSKPPPLIPLVVIRDKVSPALFM